MITIQAIKKSMAIGEAAARLAKFDGPLVVGFSGFAPERQREMVERVTALANHGYDSCAGNGSTHADRVRAAKDWLAAIVEPSEGAMAEEKSSSPAP